MKIAQINQMNSNSVRSFRGLWGNEKTTIDSQPEKWESKKIERFYYPFMDEGKDEIQKVQKQYTNNSVKYNLGNNIKYFFEECHVKDKLRFTKSEWEQYLHNQPTMNKSLKSLINASLEMLNLKQYVKIIK